MQKNLLNVSEVFQSIEGEGVSMGQLTTFVRFFGSNVQNRFEPKSYAVLNLSTDAKDLNYEQLEVNDLIKKIISMPYKPKRISLCGGEPLIQQDKILALLEEIKKTPRLSGVKIAVETNGTIKPSEAFDSFVDEYNVTIHLSNISLKSPRSTIMERVNSEALSFFNSNAKANFKFLMLDHRDGGELLDLIEKQKLHKDKIMVGQINKELDLNRSYSKHVIEFCFKNNFKFFPRLHILIFNNQKGL